MNDEFINESALRKAAAMQSAEEIATFRTLKGSLAAGLSPGNYLNPAAIDGTLASLCWIIPDTMPQGDLTEFMRQEMSRWIDITLPEYRSLERRSEHSVKGVIRNLPFVSCISREAPWHQGEILLDIDADYFLDGDDRVWLSPFDFTDCLRDKEPSPVITTIAYSVNGGYTPREHRHLGDVMHDILTGGGRISRDEYNEFSRSDPGLHCSCQEEAESICRKYLSHQILGVSSAVRLAGIYREAGDTGKSSFWEREAEERDGRYGRSPLNDAMISFRKRDFQSALELAREAAETEEYRDAAEIVEGFIHILEKRFDEALAAWKKIEKSFSDSELFLPYIYKTMGMLHLELKQAGESLRFLDRATELSPLNASFHYSRGLALIALDRRDEAIKSLRKAIRLSPESLSLCDAHRMLGQLYIQKGLKGLAQSEFRELRKKDLGGLSTITSLLRNSFL